MAGIAAGVVAAGDVESQPTQPTKLGTSLQSPATWAYIWTAAATVYLIGIYAGMIRVARGGE